MVAGISAAAIAIGLVLASIATHRDETHAAPAIPARPTPSPEQLYAGVCASTSAGRPAATPEGRAEDAELWTGILHEKGFQRASANVSGAGNTRLQISGLPDCSSATLHRVFDHPVYTQMEDLCAMRGFVAVDCFPRNGPPGVVELAQACVCEPRQFGRCSSCRY